MPTHRSRRASSSSRRPNTAVSTTGTYSCLVSGPGQIYTYRAHGPFAPQQGLRFDGEKILLDPYGRAVAVPARYDRSAAQRPGSNAAFAMKSVVSRPNGYDWEGDRAAASALPRDDHLRAARARVHAASELGHRRSDKRGTYAGLIEKIPYLKALGVTAVELLPVFQFDAQHAPEGRVNYWGYQPVSFFAPHQAFSSERDPLAVLDEFRDMVKALHRAGIEVFLDVVFNHTSEEGAGRANTLVSRSRQLHLLHPGAGPREVSRLHRLRQHAERQSVRRASA